MGNKILLKLVLAGLFLVYSFTNTAFADEDKENVIQSGIIKCVPNVNSVGTTYFDGIYYFKFENDILYDIHGRLLKKVRNDKKIKFSYTAQYPNATAMITMSIKKKDGSMQYSKSYNGLAGARTISNAKGTCYMVKETDIKQIME